MALLKFVSGKYLNNNAVSNVYNYITDLEKAYDIPSGYNVLPEYTVEEFMIAKKLYCRTDGQQLIHFIFSLAPEERLTAEKLTEVSLVIASFFGNYQVTFCIHNEQSRLHTHFMVNTISFFDGARLYHNEELEKGLLAFCQTVLPLKVELVKRNSDIAI